MPTKAREWSVEIPLPPKELSPNRRPHWAVKHEATVAYKHLCENLYIAAKRKGTLPSYIDGQVVIHADFYLCNKGPTKGVTWSRFKWCVMPKDEDNARGCLKAAQDALKAAGVLRGDSAKYVRTGEINLYSKAKDHKGRHCVVLRIESVEE